MIGGWGIFCEIAPTSLDLTDDKPTLVQVMVGAVRQRAITWANVDPDPYRRKASVGRNELIRLNHYHCLTSLGMNIGMEMVSWQ